MRWWEVSSLFEFSQATSIEFLLNIVYKLQYNMVIIRGDNMININKINGSHIACICLKSSRS